MNAEYIVLVPVGAVVVYFVIRALRYGGLKGAIFGGRVTRTAGEIRLRKGWISQVVRVHRVSGRKGTDVIIEQESKAFFGYNMTALPLGVDEARVLIRLLEDVTGSDER